MSQSESPAKSTIYEAGQRWTYRSPLGFETSRLVIGAILYFADQPPIACIAVENAPQRRADGTTSSRPIPFLPLTLDALHRSVVAYDGPAAVSPLFTNSFDQWRNDERGLSFFTVPFEGHLDRMIALQMTSADEE